MAKKPHSEDSDCWSAHIYLAKEIARCADYLAKHQHGYPGILDRINTRAKIIFYSKANEKKWRNILIEIRDGFRIYAKCDGYFYEWKDGKKGTYKHEKLPDGNFKMVPTNNAKVIINKKKEQKFRRAMELFAKYYEHLWD